MLSGRIERKRMTNNQKKSKIQQEKLVANERRELLYYIVSHLKDLYSNGVIDEETFINLEKLVVAKYLEGELGRRIERVFNEDNILGIL